MKGIKAKIRDKAYSRWILLVSNWVLQGIINADKTEKLYKILFTTLIGFILFIILNINIFFFHNYLNIIISLFIAHTFNWLINGNLTTILIHRLYLGETSKESIFNYIDELADRLKKEKSIICVLAFGSMSRGELKESSDLDISFLRQAGFSNGFKAIYFMIKENRISSNKKVPLEGYLHDSIKNIKKRYRADEPPVIIFDPKKIAVKNFEITFSIEEAKKLNHFL